MSKLLIALLITVFSVTPVLFGEDLPDYYTQLRDALFNQDLTSQDISGLYTTAEQQANSSLTGIDLNVMLSRCENIMARALLYEQKKDAADPYLVKGLDYAQKSLDQQPTSEGWRMLAENLSQLCTIRSYAWVMKNGLNVEKYCKNALALDAGNTGAQYMIAARYVYAPAPFRNFNKGIKMMQDILNNFDSRLMKDDRFNVVSSIGYALVQQKKNADAKPWLQKALNVYPDNKFIGKIFASL